MKYRVTSMFYDDGKIEVEIDVAVSGDMEASGESESCDIYVDIMTERQLIRYLKAEPIEKIVNNTDLVIEQIKRSER